MWHDAAYAIGQGSSRFSLTLGILVVYMGVVGKQLLFFILLIVV